MPTAQTVGTAVVGVAAADLAVHTLARKRELSRLEAEAAQQEEREKERARRVQESRDRDEDRQLAANTRNKGQQNAGARTCRVSASWFTTCNWHASTRLRDSLPKKEESSLLKLPLLDCAGGGEPRHVVWLAGLLLMGEWLVVAKPVQCSRQGAPRIRSYAARKALIGPADGVASRELAPAASSALPARPQGRHSLRLGRAHVQRSISGTSRAGVPEQHSTRAWRFWHEKHVADPDDAANIESSSFSRSLLESEVASVVADYLNLVEASALQIPIWNGKTPSSVVPDEPARVEAEKGLFTSLRKSAGATLRSRLRQKELQRLDEAMELSQRHRGTWEWFIAGFLFALALAVIAVVVLTFFPLGGLVVAVLQKVLGPVCVQLPGLVLRGVALASIAFLNFAMLAKIVSSAKPLLNLPNTATWSEAWEALLWDSYAAFSYLRGQRRSIDLDVSDLKSRCEAMVQTWRTRLLQEELRKHNKSGRIRDGEARGLIEALTGGNKANWERIEVPGSEEDVEAFLNLEMEPEGKGEKFTEAERRNLALDFAVGSLNPSSSC